MLELCGVHSKDIKFSLPDNYNVFLPDLQNTTTEVACGIYKLGVMDVDTEKQTILLNVAFTLEWKDDRLNITGTNTALVSFISEKITYIVCSHLLKFHFRVERHCPSKEKISGIQTLSSSIELTIMILNQNSLVFT